MSQTALTGLFSGHQFSRLGLKYWQCCFVCARYMSLVCVMRSVGQFCTSVCQVNKRACKRRAEICDAKWLRFVAPLFCSCNCYACPWALSEFFLRDVPVESVFTDVRLNLLRVYMQILLELFSAAWISGFLLEVDENHTLLVFYAASSTVFFDR